jgi:hypothetical protein
VRDGRLLIPGQTCWRVERADQFACIIEAADSSIIRRQRYLSFVGWSGYGPNSRSTCCGRTCACSRRSPRTQAPQSLPSTTGPQLRTSAEIAAAVDGAAARAVGELARDRWRTATGQSLAPIDAAHVVWPRGLEPILHDIDVVIDDRLLRVGSSNLNDRSMGFDSDCDLAIEADANIPEHEDVHRKITSVRDELVSEHLGVSVGEFERPHPIPNLNRHSGLTNPLRIDLAVFGSRCGQPAVSAAGPLDGITW